MGTTKKPDALDVILEGRSSSPTTKSNLTLEKFPENRIRGIPKPAAAPPVLKPPPVAPKQEPPRAPSTANLPLSELMGIAQEQHEEDIVGTTTITFRTTIRLSRRINNVIASTPLSKQEFLTKAIEKIIDDLEKERGEPFPEYRGNLPRGLKARGL